MGHKCFISFKTEDSTYKKSIQEDLKIDMIDKSLNEPIDSDDEDYIMRKIREEYLCDSTVTIHLIGSKSSENCWGEDQSFIKRELQASLYNGEGNSRSGILGVVLPSVHCSIYKGNSSCKCGNIINIVSIDDNTVVREFSRNYYIGDKCHYKDEDRYCILTDWASFCSDAEKYIDLAFEKRTSSVADKVTVFPKN